MRPLFSWKRWMNRANCKD
uniref:Uncharacterized protein n=1 Tax=Arundo donax TaxID=35708 RepID=A0A0A9F1L8_ARUDO